MQTKALMWMVFCFGVLCSTVSWSSPSGEDDTATVAPPADLKLLNRSVMVFRATLLGETPEFRARRAKTVISEELDEMGEHLVTLEPIQGSFMVLIGSRRAFFVFPKDVDSLEYDSVKAAAEGAASKLRQVVAESQEARSLRLFLQDAGICLLATLLFAAFLRGGFFVRRKLLGEMRRLMPQHVKALKVAQTQLVDAHYLYSLVSRTIDLLGWALTALVTYTWLSFVLSRFPYTRPWGESLNAYLLNAVGYLLESILDALPGLGIALAIFFIARGAVGLSRRILRRMAAPGNVSWLNQETLSPTTRLMAIAIWLFALAMAYPYLPGAGTDAFKGLSVLIGLMISLGASSVIGQAAAGLILTYTRTLRPGEYVRVGDHEGTVTELGMFTTTIRTGLGEVLTIPNSMITGTVTKNYSRTVQGPGYVVDTTVTIGYDTPWRQVEAMLLEAAQRTQGILSQPTPQVFQTALSDFYPEYRLVAQAVPSQPRPRAELLSMLHANIQDVFNEYGVQIMSPHYQFDPKHEKWVPREKWFAAPAKEPDEE
ncbi:mechanosensitive ion channel family protein [Pseudomonas sp. NA-150]|uniref:mechanosensitive ion channel family protein n=1 Tax=Pseudomonas sp. NA-150 TaxID=3367525 RepID=UPI0037CCB4D1